MPTATKKFNSVRATRLTLLLFISLTAGIGTAVYQPFGSGQPPQDARALPLYQGPATLDSPVRLARVQIRHGEQHR